LYRFIKNISFFLAPNLKKASSLKGLISKYYQMIMTEDGYQGRPIFSHPMSFSLVRKIIDEKIGIDQFKELSKEPVYMASLGQVHKGILKTGDTVAIKIQYPSLDRHVQEDIQSLRLIFRVLEKKGFTINHTHILKDIESITLNELNYNKERHWLQYISQILPPTVVIPVCIEHLCQKNILITHWIDHDPFFSITKLSKAVVIDLFVSFYRPLYQYGILNGDANITNIGIRNNHLVLCDFGCTIPLSSQIIKGLHNLYYGFLSHDKICQSMGLQQLGFDDEYPCVIEFIKLLMKPILNDSDAVLKPISSKDLERIVDSMSEIKYPKHLIYLQRMTLCLHHILGRIRYPINWHHIFKKYVI
jgi:predicted unusual protein kinase regulating ubiquinone biosynthesis (AarF/ABC1/UbiB family)